LGLLKKDIRVIEKSLFSDFRSSEIEEKRFSGPFWEAV